jgi:hypothetical protein
MEPRIAKVFIFITVLFGVVALVVASSAHLPGNNQGYEPVQPIAYSHRLHAGELKIDCRYCHYGADRSRHAGIPPASICMNCHKTVTTNFDAVLEERELAAAEGREERRIVSAELRKLYDALGLGEDLEPDPEKTPRPIEWIRVHNLPDFVYFDHRVHVARGLACEQCHGTVQAMERIRQFSDLSMGWCLDCHRQNEREFPPVPAGSLSAGHPVGHVSTDCASCHY